MSMLTLNGTIKNVFQVPEGKDKKTGAAYGGHYRVQIDVVNELRNGETRFDVVDLTTDSPHEYKSHIGQMVSIPVGVFQSNGSILFYILKNIKPEFETDSKI